METTRLRIYLYVFGLPLLWWGSVSLSGPLIDSPSLARELEFLPIALHASRDADYSVDAYGAMIAPVDLSIIKDAFEDRSATKVPQENLYANLQVQTTESQTDEEVVNTSTDSADSPPLSSESVSPPPSDTSGGDQNGDSGSDDSNSGSGSSAENNSPGNSANKGNGKEKDNNGQQNNGSGNGTGNDKEKDKGKKPASA